MLYYYADADGQTCGPVPVGALHAALHDGTLTPKTLAAEAGGSEWKPLAALLRYYYAADGAVLGPVRLAELPVFAAAAGDGEFMILPEGGAEWVPFGTTHPLPVVTAVAHVPAYVPPTVLRPPARPVPPAATAAGVLWIIFGLARLCDSFMALFAVNRLTVEAHGTALFIIGLHLMIALLFLNAGIMVVTGKASDFGGYARVSLCFGLLGIVLVIIFPDRFPLDAWQLVVIGLLLISGLLANSSRQAYRDWKAGKPAAPRARRARRK